MRIPKIEKFSKATSKIRVEQIDNIFLPIYRSLATTDDKKRIEFIKEVERLIRNSLEYKIYIKYLKDNMDMDRCFFFSNITNRNTNKVTIEIHHDPFTLYDIVEIVVEKYIVLEKDLNALQIADEVMRLHYENKVGLIPLTKTIHELAHNGKIFIPLTTIHGNYISFLEEHEMYIPEYIKNIMQTKIDLTKSANYDFNILEKQFVYLEVEGFKFIDLKELMGRKD